MEVVLTPYGRYLLAQGKLKPSHYAFFDDDIIYDNWYADASRAFASITVADGDAANGMAEKEYVTITSTDGTEKRYVITDADNDGLTVTGTVLSDSDNTDTGAGTAGSGEDGGIAVSIALSSATQNDFLVQLKAAIEHRNGHNGKIMVSDVPVEDDGAQKITLTQKIAGATGRVSITTDISQLTVAGFLGGASLEVQNDIEGRIQEDTPRIKPIKTRRSIEIDEWGRNIHTELGYFTTPTIVDGAFEYNVTDITPEYLQGGYLEEIMKNLQPQEDKLYALKNALATADTYSSNYPAWDVEFLQAKMTDGFSTAMRLTGIFSPPVDGTKLASESETRLIQLEGIPQLGVEGKYQTYVLDVNPEVDSADDAIFEAPETRVVIEEDFLLMSVEEKNSEFLLRNFDIELFRIEETFVDDNNEGERLLPLTFASEVQGGIPFESVVENYFDIHFDEKIPNQIICHYINDRSQGVFSDMLVECEDVVYNRETELDIYTGLSDDPGEDC